MPRQENQARLDEIMAALPVDSEQRARLVNAQLGGVAASRRNMIQGVNRRRIPGGHRLPDVGQAEPRTSGERVGAEIGRQLVAAGMPAAEAKPQAALWQSFFDAMGKRAGVDPYELFSRYRIGVAREHGAPIHQDGTLYQFAGEKARGAPLDALERAKKLEAEGADPREIWKREGWFKGPDGKWRWEIGDKDARIGQRAREDIAEKGTTGKSRLPAVLWHKSLYEAYPHLRETTAEIRQGGYTGGGGLYNPFTNHIDVDVAGGDQARRSMMLHETQHALQEREGFAKGGTSDMARLVVPDLATAVREANDARHAVGIFERAEKAHKTPIDYATKLQEQGKEIPDGVWEHLYRKKEEVAALAQEADRKLELAKRHEGESAAEIYRHLAGEAEARAVQARADMTPEERRATFPLDSYDVPADQLIVRGQTGETLFQHKPALDMSQEARMKRAEAMGFDTGRVLYHGTTGDFPAFSSKHKGRETGAPSAGEAYFLAASPKVASGYAYEATPRPFQKGSKPLTQGMKQAIDRLRYEAERDARKAADHARMDAYNQAQATIGEHMDKDAVHRFLSGHQTVTAMEAVNKSLIDQTLSEGRWRAIHEGGVTVREIYDAEDVGRDLVGETLRKIDPKAEEAYQRAKYFGYGKNKEDIKTVPLDERAPAMAEKLQALRDQVASFEDREKHVGTPEGANVLPVYAKLKNPLVHDMGGKEYRDVSYYNLIKQAKEAGHDGVVIKNTSDPANSRFDERTDVVIPFKSNQIRSVHAAFDPAEHRRADLLFQIKAFHGSPHTFDRFSLKHIGSGEGAQAYGHGLYFAENEGIAESYRKALSVSAAGYGTDDKVMKFRDTGEPASPRAISERLGLKKSDLKYSDALDTYMAAATRTGSTEAGMAELSDRYKEFPGRLADFEKIHTALDGKVGPQESGALYQVHLDVDHDDLLDWDKPLSEQSPKVQKIVRDKFAKQMGFKQSGSVEVNQRDLGAAAPYFKRDFPSGTAYDWKITKGKKVLATGSAGSEAEARAAATKVLPSWNSELDTLPGSEIYQRLGRLATGDRFSGPAAVGHHQGDVPASKALADAGIPGLRYLDAGSRTAGEGSRNIVLFDDSKVQITHRNGEALTPKERADVLNQMGREQAKEPSSDGTSAATPRGSISFAHDGETVIRLFKDADASTFLHESGHLFARVMRDLAERDGAPEGIAKDWATLRDWLGAEEGAPLSVEHEEKLARGFEAYLRDGEAPTPVLRGVFATLKDWLTKVYRSLTELGVEPSAAVKGVFDRMLGADEPKAAKAPARPVLPLAGRDAKAAPRVDPLRDMEEVTRAPTPADPLAEAPEKLSYDAALMAKQVDPKDAAAVTRAETRVAEIEAKRPAYEIAAQCIMGGLGA